MNIREVSEADRQRWDAFVSTAEGGSFLQSWAWGEFQKELGLRYWRLVAEEAENIVDVALVIKHELPMGKSWLYVPGGPLMTPFPSLAGLPFPANLAGKLQGEKGNAIFMRIDPRLSAFNLGGGWRKAKREVQPKETLVLDLNRSEDELLAGMHAKTRYNIRLAEKKGVTVRFSHDKKDLESFLQLAQSVSARSPFRYHPPEYYRAILEVLGVGEMLELAVTELDSHPLAVHFLVSFGSTVTYVHGASSSEQREVMAPHLLQWVSIKRAKEQGKRWYDFYGVSPQWPGITRFKEGFGGMRRSYVGAWDYPLSPGWYFLYNLAH